MVSMCRISMMLLLHILISLDEKNTSVRLATDGFVLLTTVRLFNHKRIRKYICHYNPFVDWMHW
jgi:hypothetical protein